MSKPKAVVLLFSNLNEPAGTHHLICAGPAPRLLAGLVKASFGSGDLAVREATETELATLAEEDAKAAAE
jgi:hypothetical protein